MEEKKNNAVLSVGVFDWCIARRLLKSAHLPLIDFKLNRNYQLNDEGACKFVFYFEDTPEFHAAYDRELEMTKARRARKAEEAARAAGIELA